MNIQAGFIGLGNIGLPMALNLCGAAGIDLVVYDVNAAAGAEPVARGARLATSVAELAGQAELIGICVRDDADVMAVMLGEGGIVATARAGTGVAIHSTVRPETLKTVAAAATQRGIHVIDAPITGGADGARARTLAYMVGGEPAQIDRFRPVFATSGQKVVVAGALGSGMVLKLCNNLITYLHLVAADESLRLAKAAGLAPERLFELTTENGNLTKTMRAFLDNREHGPARYGAETMRRAFTSFAGIAEKDLDCAIGAARDAGVELPAGELARALIRNVYLA
jgi:3-hydroxyisobutyrate dehydrogenase-like beta-hydroxyacid dehydrogenase